MMTEEDIKKVYGDDVILLFKGRAPFTEVKPGIPSGVLVQNSEGKIPCYICGKWFEQLHTHLRFSHKQTAKSYKDEYGFNREAPLCSKVYSEKMSKWASVPGGDVLKDRIHLMNEKRMLLIKSGVYKAKGRIGKGLSMQEKNQRNTCPEQMRQRVELLTAKFGAHINIRGSRKVDSGAVKWILNNYGTWNEFKSQKGMFVDVSSQKKKRADLIYDLREYIVEFKSWPWGRKIEDGKVWGATRLNGFPHSQAPYKREFGSMTKTKSICGVKKGHDSSYYLWN